MDLNTLITFLMLLISTFSNQNINIPNVSNNLFNQNINNQDQNINQENNQSDFNVAGSTSTVYYLRVILEGIERERATNVPEQKMDGVLYCDNQNNSGIRARNIRSYGITQITVPNDCDNPVVLLNIRHWLSRRVNLTSTSENNPQDVFFNSGDVNGDNIVDDADNLSVLFNYDRSWDYSTSTTERPDLNLDNIVNDRDLNLVLNNFGNEGDE
ncbi:MAG: hypothetical protein KatS3mg095_0690 [Candidatus Parcubacteria bacterium]|nr:MAG: hypothetical protein KatS3mg095_0690 [Candidatus Parcubacteria bacterium]